MSSMPNQSTSRSRVDAATNRPHTAGRVAAPCCSLEAEEAEAAAESRQGAGAERVGAAHQLDGGERRVGVQVVELLGQVADAVVDAAGHPDVDRAEDAEGVAVGVE